LVNNILRNRTDGSLTLTNQTLLQNFKDSISGTPIQAKIIFDDLAKRDKVNLDFSGSRTTAWRTPQLFPIPT